jgi:hypothetical protein
MKKFTSLMVVGAVLSMSAPALAQSRAVKGLPNKKISYRFYGRGQGAGGKNRFDSVKLDNLFLGSP